MFDASQRLSWKRQRKLPWTGQLEVRSDLGMKTLRIAVGEDSRLLCVKEPVSDKGARVAPAYSSEKRW